MIGWRELLIILVIVLLVFGTKKLANIGKDLGGAIGGFKQGLKEGEDKARPDALGDDKPRSDPRGDGGPG